MEDPIDFADLSNDQDLKSKIMDFQRNLSEVGEMLEKFRCIDTYDNLSPQDKVRYELFQAFAINSLYWFYLRVKGVDPNQHEIRSEINRIRDFMVRSKKIHEKQTQMPRVDQDAAKRFVRSGLWAPKQSNSDDQNDTEKPQNSRKRKRESDGDDDAE